MTKKWGRPIEFDGKLACSIKDLTFKQNNNVKPTTRFFRGKMLMFAKVSLISIVYDTIQAFCFPNKKTREIYEKYLIKYIYPYHTVTDTDSLSLFFIFVCKSETPVPDEKYRDCLFKVLIANEVYRRSDTSHDFWDKFSARNASLRRKLGYYEIEHIDDPCEVTIAVNPKEHLEKFQSEATNKNHKGLKRGSKGMEFENYAKRINSVRKFLVNPRRKNRANSGFQ